MVLCIRGAERMKKDFIVRRSIITIEGTPYVSTYSEEELVHCRECKHGRKITEGYYDCGNIDFTYVHEGGWFCADGVLKE